MQKLYLLTALTDEQRTELTETVDLESVTVRELLEQVNALRNEKQQAENAVTEAREAQALLEAQVRELESRPVDVAIPEPSHEVQNLQDAMRRINAEQEAYNAKVENDHFKQVQEIHAQHRAETDALRAEYEEKLAAANASQAEATDPDSKEIFKAYLANAIDAAKRMTTFLTAHPSEPCREQAKKFFAAMLQEVQA